MGFGPNRSVPRKPLEELGGVPRGSVRVGVASRPGGGDQTALNIRERAGTRKEKPVSSKRMEFWRTGPIHRRRPPRARTHPGPRATSRTRVHPRASQRPICSEGLGLGNHICDRELGSIADPQIEVARVSFQLLVQVGRNPESDLSSVTFTWLFHTVLPLRASYGR